MTTGDLRSVRAELMLPHEIAEALAIGSVAYLPLGTIEWHSAHLPIGLDGLTAQGICSRAAAQSGGIVLPPLFYGTGGGHSAYPWTIMATSPAPIAELLWQSLTRLSDFGVRTSVLFSGHFPDEQLHLIDDLASRWNESDRGMRVVALSVNRAEADLAPDHAGIFETSLLWAMSPDRVQLQQLRPLSDAPANDPNGDSSGDHRHHPEHPLYGVFGPDPRTFDPSRAGKLLDQIVAWTVAQVQPLTQRPRVRPSP